VPFLAAIPAAAWLAAGTAAAGTAYSAASKSQADNYNAQVERNEQRVAVDQSNAQANIVSRQGVIQRGKQLAAFGGAGVGYGGSSEEALDQSAVNNELDALNTKYKGAIAGYGYGVQSSIDQTQAGQQIGAGLLLAGGQALNKVSPYFGTPGGGT
jgi:hypothetical protein